MKLEELFNRGLIFEVIRCMFTHEGERLYSAKIAQFLKRDPGNIHKIIDRLCAEGLVSKRKDKLIVSYTLRAPHPWFGPLRALCMKQEESPDVYMSINEEGHVNVLTMEIIYQGFTDQRIALQWKISPIPSMAIEYKNDYIRCFMPKTLWQKHSRTLIQRLRDQPLIMKTIQHKTEKIIRRVERLQKIMEKNKNRVTSSRHVALFDELSEYGRLLNVYGIPIVIMETGTGNLSMHVQDILKRHIKENVSFNVASVTTTLLDYPALTWSQKYRIALIDGALRIQSHSVKPGSVAAGIVRVFYWINFGYKGPELSPQDVLIELNELCVHPVRVLKQMKRDSVNYPKELRVAQRRYYTQLHISARDCAFIEAVALANWLKLLRKDVLFNINTLIYRLLEPHKGHLTHEDMGYLTLAEARILLHTRKVPVNRKVLRARKRYSLYMADTRRVVTGDEARQFAGDHFERAAAVDEAIRLLEGQTASLGDGRLVEGVVRIVIDMSDIVKVQEGDILVSTATIPPMVPAMKKAAAIVTDVGGITSHAAIVARELNKPCIIGTKHATKIFKDGDRVVVDVRHGYVKFA